MARGILGGFRKLVPHELIPEVTQVNGDSGIVSYLDGRPFSAMTVHVREGRIQTIYIVSNPDKLSHIPGLLPIA